MSDAEIPRAEAPEGKGQITLTENEDGWWTARERTIGVTTQGETRAKALENLDEAVEGARAALESDTPAPEPTVPWFDTDEDADSDGE